MKLRRFNLHPKFYLGQVNIQRFNLQPKFCLTVVNVQSFNLHLKVSLHPGFPTFLDRNLSLLVLFQLITYPVSVGVLLERFVNCDLLL